MPLRLVPQRDRKLNRIFGAGKEEALARNEPLFEAGDPAGRLWLVRSGHVRLVLPCASGAPDAGRTVGVAGPSELFGEDALVPGARRTYGAVAGEAARVTGAEGDTALRGLRRTRHTLPRLLEAARADLVRCRWSPPGSSGPTTAQRLADVVLELAERFGDPEGEAVRIPHWFTHEVLGDLAGAHRSTVTTILNDWIYDGVLVAGSDALVVASTEDLEGRSSGREAWLTRR